MITQKTKIVLPDFGKIYKNRKGIKLIMETGTQEKQKSKSLKLLIKGSLVIIGLFIVFYCSVAVILIHFGKDFEINKNIEINRNNGIDKGNENNEIDKKVEIDKKNIISKYFENKIFILILVIISLPILVFIIVFFRFSCFKNIQP